MRYLFALALVGCPHAPPSPDPLSDVVVVHTDGGVRMIDAPDADVYDLACEQLASLGCPEGTGPCHDVLMRAQDSQLTQLSPACVAMARTVGELRVCSPAWAKGCAGR